MKPKQNPIVLNLPRPVSLLLVRGRHIVLAITNNTWFPSPTPALATVTNDLNSLESTETAAQTRAKGTAAARDLALAVVINDLKGLKSYVASIVAQNPTQATAIIESAAMSPRRVTLRDKPELAVVMTVAPGEAAMRAKSAGRGAAYDWQYSSNGGQTWVDLGVTTVANNVVTGLVAGTTYLFRFRTTLKKVTGSWSQTISFLAH